MTGRTIVAISFSFSMTSRETHHLVETKDVKARGCLMIALRQRKEERIMWPCFLFPHRLHRLYYLYLQVISFATLSGNADAKYVG